MNLTIYCLDVSSVMQDIFYEKKSFLKLANEFLSLAFKRKIFSESKDEFGLIFFGANETKNELSKDGEFQNVSVAFNPSKYHLDVLKCLSEELPLGFHKSDFLDAIIVALHMIHKAKNSKKYSSAQVIIISNLFSDFDINNVEEIVQGFQVDGFEIELLIVSHMNEIDVDYENMDDKTRRKMNLKNEIKEKSEECINEMMNMGVSLERFSLKFLLNSIKGFEKQTTKSAAWKCNLTIGKNFSISCVAYALTKQAKLKKSWKKCLVQDDVYSSLTQVLVSSSQDGGVVDERSNCKAFKFGTDIIPLTESHEKMMKYITNEKKLDILSFTPASNVPQHLWIEDQAHVVMGTDKKARTAVSSFVQAMTSHEDEMVAIACYVYNKGHNPKLVALLPQTKSDCKFFMMVYLPFAEVIKPLVLPPLQSEITEEVEDLVENIIDKMDLTSVSDEELYQPEKTLNPFFQRTFEAISQRLVKEDALLTPASDYITKILSPNPLVIDQCKEDFEKLNEIFPRGKLSEKEIF